MLHAKTAASTCWPAMCLGIYVKWALLPVGWRHRMMVGVLCGLLRS